MAEWGKGDPRWIVEERPDGKRRKKFEIFFSINLKNEFSFQLQIQIIGIGKKRMLHNGQKIN